MRNVDGPLITVIVPIYNSERYLKRCLESIQKQTYEELEVLMIDDGSSDLSVELCKTYVHSDPRFCLIVQENQGSSAARNVGLSNAHGSLIGFVDSDDYIDPCMFEKLYRALDSEKADVSLCDVYYKGKQEHIHWKNGTYRGQDAIFSEFINGRVINRVYNKLYRAEIVKNVRFPVNRNMMEDASWTPRVLEKAEILTRIAEPLYYYTENEAGLTQSTMSSQKVCSRFANLLDRESICLRKASSVEDERKITRELMMYLRQIMESSDTLELFDVKGMMMETVKENYQLLKRYSDGKDEETMLDAILEGDLSTARRQYRKAVWLYSRSVRTRLRLCKQRMSDFTGRL